MPAFQLVLKCPIALGPNAGDRETNPGQADNFHQSCTSAALMRVQPGLQVIRESKIVLRVLVGLIEMQ